MELRQIRYFIGVSEAGSLLQASTRLHVAQPALGQQITALEEELGARLLVRSSRGVQVTDAGKRFLEHARVVLADVERARAAVRDLAAEPTGDVAIGLPTTVSLIATLPLLQACRERLPRVRLKLVEAYSGFLREWLLSGRLELALLYGDAPEAGLQREPLLDDELALVTSMQAPLLPDRVPLQALAHRPLVLPGTDHGLRRIVDAACSAERLPLDIVAEIESLPSVKRAVEAGIAATVLSPGSVAEEVAAGRLQAAAIDDPRMLRRVVCATSLARPATGAAAAVAALLASVLHGMVASGAWPGRWVGRLPADASERSGQPLQ